LTIRWWYSAWMNINLFIQKLIFSCQNCWYGANDSLQKTHFVSISFFWILKLYKTYFLIELWSSKCITFYYNTKVILRCCYIQIYCCREWLFIAYLLLLAPKDSRQKCYFFLFYWTKRFLKSICGDPQFLDFLISQSS
jgi:hypothetical protein